MASHSTCHANALKHLSNAHPSGPLLFPFVHISILFIRQQKKEKKTTKLDPNVADKRGDLPDVGTLCLPFRLRPADSKQLSISFCKSEIFDHPRGPFPQPPKKPTPNERISVVSLSSSATARSGLAAGLKLGLFFRLDFFAAQLLAFRRRMMLFHFHRSEFAFAFLLLL